MNDGPAQPTYLSDPEFQKLVVRFQKTMRIGVGAQHGFDKIEKTPNTLWNVTINNDDLGVRGLNKDRGDSGIRTNQLTIGASWPVTQGILKNGSMYLGITGTTFVGGESASVKPGSGTVVGSEPDKQGKPIYDGYQAPGGELYIATAAAHKPLGHNGKGVDLDMRVDAGVVSGKKHLMDMWHAGPGATYFRSQINTVKEAGYVNLEPVATYHFNDQTSKWDPKLLGGVSLGNGYQGAMVGGELAYGHRGLTASTHSAQFGNSNIPFTGGLAAPAGAVRVAGFVKLYASTDADYRTQLSADNPLLGKNMTVTIVEEYRETEHNYQTSQRAYFGDEVKLEDPAYTLLYSNTMQVRLPSLVPHYHFNPINAEAGVDARWKVNKAVDIGARVTISTNPVRPVINEEFTGDIQKEVQRRSMAYMQERAEHFGKPAEAMWAYNPIALINALMPTTSGYAVGPINEFNTQGEISVRFSLGKGKSTTPVR